jgi:hypothetical protein
MASSTARRRGLVKTSIWILGGYLIYKLLFSGGGGGIPTRISESAHSSRLGLDAAETPMAIESGGQWLIAMVQTVIGWIGSLLTVALVFAVIAIAIMLISDWSGKRS